MITNNNDIVGIYVMSSEARIPVTVLSSLPETKNVVAIAHERTTFTEAALNDGRLECVIAQNAGHLVRSAVRKLKAITDKPVIATHIAAAALPQLRCLIYAAPASNQPAGSAN